MATRIVRKEKVWTYRNPMTGEVYGTAEGEYGYESLVDMKLTEKQQADVVAYLYSLDESNREWLDEYSDIEFDDSSLWYDVDDDTTIGTPSTALLVGVWKEIEEEIDGDFYAVQMRVDGFGHDTATCGIYQTYEEAKEHADRIDGEVVAQQWGEYYEQWD